MSKGVYFCGGSMLAVALTFALSDSAAAQAAKPVGAAAAAAAAPTTPAPTEVQEVVVTGSYIAGTPETAAQPVDVIGSQELKAQGNPTIVQLVKTLPASQSALGESNRYNAGAGTATINLRGFGAART